VGSGWFGRAQGPRSVRCIIGSVGGCAEQTSRLSICLIYIYIYTHTHTHTHTSPRVMDQRSITWTQRSNRPIEPHAPNQPTPCARPPRPHHPSDPAPPVRPRAARSTPRLLTPLIPTLRRPTSHCLTSCPYLLRPTPPPLVSTASCYASRRPTTSERPYLSLSSPLPPVPMPPLPRASLLASATSSYIQRLSHRHPCLLRPCASQND
jgi:hypothetical protein